MPYYVLLQFDNDEEAKEAVKSWTEPTGGYAAFQLKGVWRKPSLFCDNSDLHRSRKTSGWSRGPKWGWWVCSACGKPTKGWAGLWRFDSAMGINLLPDSIINEGPRPRSSWRSPKEWTWLLGGASSESPDTGTSS